jgi:enamine deaminase RidA (YjgF/YER057c/UK114 family)
MLTKHKPATIAPPVARYTHGVEAPTEARWLYVSGQVGLLPDGTIAGTPEGQIEAAFGNLRAVLESAGMGPDDIVRLNIYLTSHDHFSAMREARDKVLGDIEPASTGLVVAGLARPEWIIEVEAVAAA